MHNAIIVTADITTFVLYLQELHIQDSRIIIIAIMNQQVCKITIFITRITDEQHKESVYQRQLYIMTLYIRIVMPETCTIIIKNESRPC